MLRVLCKSSPKVARDIIKTADNDLSAFVNALTTYREGIFQFPLSKSRI